VIKRSARYWRLQRKSIKNTLQKKKKELVNLRISAEQLIDAAKKRFEESEEMVKESMKRVQEDHGQELEKQRVLLQKQFKDKYLQMMSDRACILM
jgi:hypothetical protein